MSSQATDLDKVNPKAGPHCDHAANDDGGDMQRQNLPEAKVMDEAHKSETAEKKDSTSSEVVVDDCLATEVYSTMLNDLSVTLEVRVRTYDERDVKVTVGAEVYHYKLTKAETKSLVEELEKQVSMLATTEKLRDELRAGLRRPLAEWLADVEEGINKLSENGLPEMAPLIAEVRAHVAALKAERGLS
ncbi:hypothetical protein W97_02729 [Coniosporium apollinis CBS 100218]|uniref:Uncharacterized protein n=1 Tax=Coniosporium apollinis (strain CBS 100218) TaxID=1168221 RepID=R7YPA5_CONA1|nr:uncharacterized protein W97_02729 [Coniosporium apollinis CBS 100218]EON63501.1 hypothetical protein W97_02729 [Coniosporium apollinis CBS 100218]